MPEGWISLQRRLRDHWVWKKKPFSRGQAWIDMILRAGYKENRFLLGNEVIICKRGEFITSESKLAIEWGWSRKRVSTFLKLLQSELMVVRKTDNKKTSITICNYDSYQNKGTAKEQQKSSRGTAKEQQRNTINKGNKGNKEKKVFIAPSLQEVTAYCLERKSVVNPQTFRDYYSARGWKYGTGKPMVDWKAAIRTWENKASENKKAEVDNAFS